MLTILIALALNTAHAATTKVTWHGHAAFEIATPKGKVIMIDPWLSNPFNPAAKSAVQNVKKLDYIIVTHGHGDHVGDAVALGKKTKARLIGGFELASNIGSLLGYPKDQMGYDTLINPGGEIAIADGEVTVSLTPAVHSSGIEKSGVHHYAGVATGVVLRIKDGPTIYHSGDTAYFSDMKLIGERFNPDVALLNICGHFGMEPAQAVQAAEAVGAETVIPHHFKTMPVLTQDPAEFVNGVKDEGMSPVVLEPGHSIEFEGRARKKGA